MRAIIRSGILIVILVVALGKESTGEACEDINDWCDSFTPHYCNVITVAQGCPKSCKTCLPEGCQECEHNCTALGENDFECTCFSGYRVQSDGFTCEDIDECAEDPLACEQGKECVNVKGNFSCVDNKCVPYRNQNYQLSVSYEDRCCKMTNGQCGQNRMNTHGATRVKSGIKIINGTTADEGMWPWQVYIPVKQEICGGSLLNNLWIISAAHCFKNVIQSDIDELKLSVWLGVTDRTRLFTPGHRRRYIAEIILHEEYKYPKHDIALVRMNEPVAESDFIKPICLPNGEIPPDGIVCVTTGFGEMIPFSGIAADKLQQVEVPMVNTEECRRSNERLNATHPIDTERMVCAGYKEGGKDACRGDSGGPLVCQRCDSCDWFLVGVTSFGEGCARADLYGVYTNVEYYEKWIESHIDSVTVNKAECRPADWTEWNEWGGCTHECGGGTRTRSRACVGGDLGLEECPGEAIQTQPCNTHQCGDNFWSNWSPCSETCGGGVQQQELVCVSTDCKQRLRTRTCNENQCPTWDKWTSWGQCSTTCGAGEKVRTRSCENGNIGDRGCRGQHEQTKTCNEDAPCPEWTTWSAWSKCSVTCNRGEQTSSRQCVGGVAGTDCPGKSTKTKTCRKKKCTLFNWGWTSWSPCSHTCGGGQMIRTQTTSSCQPSECTPDDPVSTVQQEKECNTHQCHGTWTKWSQWKSCSVSCGQGETIRTRTCENGPNCPGNSEEVKSCNERECPHDWSTWTEWSSCSKTCGGGVRRRTRFCGEDNAIYDDCPGTHFDELPCNTDACASACQSFQCQSFVLSGYCVTQRTYVDSVCDPSCCSGSDNGFCRDTWESCKAYGILYCHPQYNSRYIDFIRLCLGTCQYCP